MSLFNKIYDLNFSPLLTPYNLIETLKITNYVSLNMTKNEVGIIAELKCIIDNDTINFIYEFDANDYIQSLYYYEENQKHYLFNRNQELIESTKAFNQNIKKDLDRKKCS